MFKKTLLAIGVQDINEGGSMADEIPDVIAPDWDI